MSRLYITDAIDYANGSPHLGHAYEKVLTDCIARAHRQAGTQTFFLLGTDEHGQKVERTARKEGLEPQAYIADVIAKIAGDWPAARWDELMPWNWQPDQQPIAEAA